MADSTRITLIVDFGRSRQFPDPDRNDHCSLNTTIGKLLYAMLNCSRGQPYASNFRLNDCRPCSLSFIEDCPPPRGGGSRREPRGSLGYKSRANPGYPSHSIGQRASGNISPLTKPAAAYPYPPMLKVPILYRRSL